MLERKELCAELELLRYATGKTYNELKASFPPIPIVLWRLARNLGPPRRHTTAPLLHRSRAAAAERAQTTLEVPELISTMV